MLPRIVKHEVEASLISPDGGRCGKSEYKVYGDGERRLTIRLQRLSATPGGTLTVAIGGRECARFAARSPGLVHDARSSRGDMVHEPREGDAVEVRLDGALIASGVYRPD